ncbi:hypothetical protein [Rhodoligotrophos defluvii]|uniref:hypothetical protein n=1 Tax=Rhodoligotrophos defluvii TaxID=2561934 RepID=UPI0010C9D2AB|nr:hypothetical protein [Rhodoligotrophos defluvii]
MGKVKIPYYVVVKGRGYWRPTARMRSLGFTIVRCGADGPAAWAIAAQWNQRWQAARRGLAGSLVATAAENPSSEEAEEKAIYPAESLGDAFRRYRRTNEWRLKKPRTREDWWRGWRRIRLVFGDVDPRSVKMEDISAWRAAIEETVSLREAHRALKIWRALWKVAAAMKYCERDEDPSLVVRNRAERGRSATWTEGEVVRLVKQAWREGYRGLAAAMAVMWDTQFSPGDVRSLTAGQIACREVGGIFFTERGKTGASVGGILSKRSAKLLDAYVKTLGFALHDDAPVFRTRGLTAVGAGGGRPRPPSPYTKDRFAADFRVIRSLTFGEGEDRQLLDFRRSGAVEAIAGGAEAEQLSRAMGNSLSASNSLFETYVPVKHGIVREVTQARKKGRRKLRSENE